MNNWWNTARQGHLIVEKEVDWSTLNDGITIPQSGQDDFYECVGKHYELGVRNQITILMDGRSYKSNVYNQNFDRERFAGHSEMLQIRYSTNDPIRLAIKNTFAFQYEYISNQRNLPENAGKRTRVTLPAGQKAYIQLYTSNIPNTFYLTYTKPFQQLKQFTAMNIQQQYEAYLEIECPERKEEYSTASYAKLSDQLQVDNIFDPQYADYLPEWIAAIRTTEMDINAIGQYSGTLEMLYHFLRISHLFESNPLQMQRPTPSVTTDVPQELAQYIAAIATKPFVLLAGISGTGKSRIVRQLARSCDTLDADPWNIQKPQNFEMIQVRPNWHDSTELLGYISRIDGKEYVITDFLRFVAKAWEHPNTPFFLCLDEMNLAPVEQYFAEYLSVIESRKLTPEGHICTDPILKKNDEKWYEELVNELTADEVVRAQFMEQGIAIPSNLIVMGTVNMDETTFSFSRKVLDRAMTIEMNIVDIHGGLTDSKADHYTITSEQLLAKAVEGKDIYDPSVPMYDTILDYLDKLNAILEGTAFKIAYRTRNEFLVYGFNRGLDNVERTLDEMTSMKVLSRIEGDEAKLMCQNNTQQNVLDAILELLQTTIGSANSISCMKIKEMQNKLKQSGYTSYWA